MKLIRNDIIQVLFTISAVCLDLAAIAAFAQGSRSGFGFLIAGSMCLLVTLRLKKRASENTAETDRKQLEI